MIPLFSLLIGGMIGWYRARALGGDRKDRLQYTVVFAIIALIVGLFAWLIFERMR